MTNNRPQKSVIFFLFYILLINIYSCQAQSNEAKRFTCGLHDYVFYTDGTYIETIDEMILAFPCQYCSQCIVDWGIYSEKNGHYILNSSSKIDSMRMYKITSFHELNDSLIIEFFSPYEQIIKRDIKYAIYTYCIQIRCDSSLSGRLFEQSFNEKHRFCMSGLIRVPKPNDVHLREIKITIYPNDLFYKDFISFSSDPEINIKYLSQNNDNHFFINMPDFEYLSLSYRNRIEYKIKRNKNRILCGGVYFQRRK